MYFYSVCTVNCCYLLFMLFHVMWSLSINSRIITQNMSLYDHVIHDCALYKKCVCVRGDVCVCVCHRFFLFGFLALLIFLVHEGQYQLWSSGGAWMMPAHRLHEWNEHSVTYTHFSQTGTPKHVLIIPWVKEYLGCSFGQELRCAHKLLVWFMVVWWLSVLK